MNKIKEYLHKKKDPRVKANKIIKQQYLLNNICNVGLVLLAILLIYIKALSVVTGLIILIAIGLNVSINKNYKNIKK